MSTLVKVSGSIVAVPEFRGGASSEIDLGRWGSGDVFEDLRQREDWRLHTDGPLGQHFVDLEIAPVLAQLYLDSRNDSEIAIRLNGLPATFVSASPFDPSVIASGDSLTLTIDDAPPVLITFGAEDRGWVPALARINGAVGQRVARRTPDGRLQLVGVNSGDRAARDAGWQHGSIEIAGAPASLAKLGLAVGVTFGSGIDFVVRRRLFLEPPTAGARAITRVEVSGSGELVTHIAGF